jgi:hypothetical protein
MAASAKYKCHICKHAFDSLSALWFHVAGSKKRFRNTDFEKLVASGNLEPSNSSSAEPFKAPPVDIDAPDLLCFTFPAKPTTDPTRQRRECKTPSDLIQFWKSLVPSISWPNFLDLSISSFLYLSGGQ